MIPYARLSPGPGFELGRAALYYAQRAVTLPLARRAISSCIAAAIRRSPRAVCAPPDAGRADAGRADALAGLTRDGFARIAPLVSEEAAGKMLDYFLGESVVGPEGDLSTLDRLPPDTPAAPYPLATVMRCPGLAQVLNDPFVLAVATGYLACRPTLSSVGVRWSFPTSGRRIGIQRFHRDVDDWRFLKLFVYLTDVDDDSGPHCYVRGTHRVAFGVRARPYEGAQLERRFGSDAVMRITGPRGASFMADTLGIHCGSPPRRRARLILQAQYSLLPVFAFQYPPAEPRPFDLDGYSNRLFFRPAAAAQGVRN